MLKGRDVGDLNLCRSDFGLYAIMGGLGLGGERRGGKQQGEMRVKPGEIVGIARGGTWGHEPDIAGGDDGGRARVARAAFAVLPCRHLVCLQKLVRVPCRPVFPRILLVPYRMRERKAAMSFDTHIFSFKNPPKTYETAFSPIHLTH